MKEAAYWYLENIDMRDVFCPIKMKDNMDNAHVTKVKKNSFIFMPEDKSDRVFLIVEGQVKIGTYSENGKELTKTILQKGEVFGELALVGESKRKDFAYAIEDSAFCDIPTENLKMMMKERGNLSLFFMKIMGSRVLEMEKRLESMVFKDSRTRVVEFLLELVNKKGQRVGYEWVVRNFLTHQEIANITATSRQTVTTILNELKTHNLITFNRKRLLVRDLELLKSEIEG